MNAGELSPELVLVDPGLRAPALERHVPPQWAIGPPARIVPLGGAPPVLPPVSRGRLRRSLASVAATVIAMAVTVGALELPSLSHHFGSTARARPGPARELVWARDLDARGYRVLVVDGDKVVLDTVTSDPRVRLNLVSGAYRWWVWPLAADGSQSPPIVQASLVVQGTQ